MSVDDLQNLEAPSMCGRDRARLVDGELPIADPNLNGYTTFARDEARDDQVIFAAGSTSTHPLGIVAVAFRCSAGGVGFPEVIGFYDSDLEFIGQVDLGDIDQQEHSNVLSLALSGDGYDISWVTNGEPCHYGADVSVPRSARITIENTVIMTTHEMTGESDVPCTSQASTDWIVDFEGVGPIDLGMTLDEATAAADWTEIREERSCDMFTLLSDDHALTASMYPGGDYAGDDPGRVVRLWYTSPSAEGSALTSAGIGIGSSEEELVAAYGDELIDMPIGDDPLDWYERMGVTAIYALDDGERSITFAVNPVVGVLQINVGTTGQYGVLFEACG